MFALARTFALIGVAAEPVYVEVDIGGGLPSFTIVGLPDAAVRESRERVRSALRNSGFKLPGPPDHGESRPGRRSQGRSGIRSRDRGGDSWPPPASCRGPSLDNYAMAGELALDGAIRPAPGALAMAEGAQGLGLRGVAVAPSDAGQAALVGGLDVMPVEHVTQLAELAQGGIEPVPTTELAEPRDEDLPDLSDLRGHPALRRCLEIAAAGAHSLLLIGPPGGGKTLALQRLPSLLPPLSLERGDRGHPDRRRLRRERRAATAASVSGAAPHGVRAGPGRRRGTAAARGGDPGPSRRPLPR